MNHKMYAQRRLKSNCAFVNYTCICTEKNSKSYELISVWRQNSQAPITWKYNNNNNNNNNNNYFTTTTTNNNDDNNNTKDYNPVAATTTTTTDYNSNSDYKCVQPEPRSTTIDYYRLTMWPVMCVTTNILVQQKLGWFGAYPEKQ